MEYRLEPFSLERALAGEPVCDCHGNDVPEIKHFESVDQDSVCIAAVLGVGENARLLVYSLHQAQRDLRIKTPIKSKHPFDADKLAEGWIVKTCDGREVKQVTVFDVDSPYTVYGVLNGIVERWTQNGAYSSVYQDSASIIDLVMYKPE